MKQSILSPMANKGMGISSSSALTADTPTGKSQTKVTNEQLVAMMKTMKKTIET